MNKPFAVALVAALLAGCGSSSSTAPSTPVAGTVGGKAFIPADVQAVELSSASPCGVPLPDPTTVATVGVRAVEVKLTSYAGACADLTSVACQAHGGKQAVTLLVSRLSLLPPWGAPASLAGDYTVTPSLTAFTLEYQNGFPTGFGHVAFAEALAPDPACVGTAYPANGSVHIAQDGATIAGSVSLTFTDGSTVSGAFSAPLCAGAPGDVCAFVASRQLCTPSTTCL